MSVELINTGKEPMTLVARFAYEMKGNETYADFLRASLVFGSVPEVLPDTFQTGGRFRESSQPRATIAPGGSLSAKWSVEGNELSSDEMNQSSRFPREGRYHVRARVWLKTLDGRTIKLWSNEQAFQVGDAPKAPSACAARVMMPDEAAGTARLNVGADDGVKEGETFRVVHSLRGHWELKVIEVGPEQSTVIVTPHFGSGNRRRPDFPRSGAKAKFVPSKE